MEEKKRKSSRSFELEKGSKRSFDLQKTSARKFDLSKDSDEVSLEELKKDLLADGKIDAEEVNKLREVLFADGKIDQEEADFLFEINDAVSGKPNDSSWKAFFVEAISDYLLNDENSPGVIDENEGKWLEAKINNDGKLDTVERALVASLRRKSKSMPKSLSVVLSQVASRFNLKKDEVPAAEAAIAMAALAATKSKASRFSLEKQINDTATINIDQLKKDILDDGKIDREEVETLRKTLYADGKIDQKEADILFELNDAVSGKKNDPSWNKFFVQAISDYLLNDEKSPGVIDEDEGKWLVEKIGADGKVDGLEKELLVHLKKKAKKMPAAVTALMSGAIVAGAANSEKTDLQQLKKELLADGKIDKEEVEQLRKVIYADGKIDQEEADFLFELNDAVSGKKNDPSWNKFFVQAISDYLLNDEKSPGVIDEDEGKWLVEKIGADGQVDGLEKDLLGHLKKHAKKMPSSVTTLLNNSSSPSDAGTTTSNDDNSGVAIKKWIAIITALLVAGGVGYYYFSNSNKTKEDESPQIVQTESVSSENKADSLKKENVMAKGNDLTADNTIDSDAKPTVDAGEKTSASNVQNTMDEDNIGSKNSSNNRGDSKPNDGESSNSVISASGTSSKTSAAGTIEQKAHDVWKGVYGNNPERRRNLGSDYEAVQKRVNEMRRQGLY